MDQVDDGANMPRSVRGRHGLRRRGYPAGFPARQLGAVADAELAEDAGEVRLDGLLADPQGRGDLLVHLALGDEARDLELRRRQLVAAGGLLAQDLAAAGEGRRGLLLPGDRAEPLELGPGGPPPPPGPDPGAPAPPRGAPRPGPAPPPG